MLAPCVVLAGNGPALVDGSFDGAALNRPQGVAYDARARMLYIADTENHAVRAADLASRTVVTLAGNGSKGDDYRGGGSQQKFCLGPRLIQGGMPFGLPQLDSNVHKTHLPLQRVAC